MTTKEIRERLFAEKDEKYADFQVKLIPTLAKETVIGIRTPVLRKLAKKMAKEEGIEHFLQELPHLYFEENQLQAFIISDMKDYAECLKATETFLPLVDNWATCDQMSPKIFKKHRKELLSSIVTWLPATHEYTVRFGIGMLMEHFLDEDFDEKCLKLVANIRREEYYIQMMQAWYFATALVKQYPAALPYLQEQRLNKWTHNKTIQKAVESYRITDEQKAYLKTLKRK